MHTWACVPRASEIGYCCSTTAKQQLGLETRGTECTWHVLTLGSRGHNRKGLAAHPTTK